MKNDFFNERIEFLIPVFLGVLGSFIICSLIAAGYSFFPAKDFYAEEFPVIESEISTNDYFNEYFIAPFLYDTDFSLAVREKAHDPIMEAYRNPELTEQVIDFFAGLCNNRQVAHAILHNSNVYDVPPALAFALSWEESRFNPRAVNIQNRNGSIDRGLFQLNNRSFPYLELHDFFSINSNARHGISHLKFCLDTGGTEISGLAMYNAGTARVFSNGAPKTTLDYVARILDNRTRIENRFSSFLRAKEEESRFAETAQIEEPPEIEEPEITPPAGRVSFTVSPL